VTATRLNRYLARRGIASRRGADLLIRSGRVTVNGVPATVGSSVEPERDRIVFDRRRVAAETERVTLLLNKPAGVVSTARDERGRTTVLDLVAEPGRAQPSRHVPPAAPVPGLVPVGRLDAGSRGLLLLSNDGELVHRLSHPRYGVRKLYRVSLDRAVSEGQLRRLVEGLRLEDGWARAHSARLAGDDRHDVVEVEMEEGRKHEVRRLFAALGLEVTDLRRVGVGPLGLGRIPEGRWRRLTEPELAALHAAVGLPPPRPTGSP
jgi:23S rRNA pseudouridine2605 synthase